MINNLIPLRLQLFAIAISALLLLGIISLIRRGKLKEGYSILWFFIGFGFLLVAIWTNLLRFISRIVGVEYEPATLFAILLVGSILILIHITVLVSGFDKKDKTLAQNIGLLVWELNKLKEENEEIKKKLAAVLAQKQKQDTANTKG